MYLLVVALVKQNESTPFMRGPHHREKSNVDLTKAEMISEKLSGETTQRKQKIRTKTPWLITEAKIAKKHYISWRPILLLPPHSTMPHSTTNLPSLSLTPRAAHTQMMKN